MFACRVPCEKGCMGCHRSWPGVDFCDGAVHVKGLVFLIGQKQGFSPGGVTSGLRRIQMEGWRDQDPPFAGLKCGLRRASPRPAPAMELLWWPGPAASPWHGVLGNSCVFWLLALLTLWHGWGGGCVCVWGGGGGRCLPTLLLSGTVAVPGVMYMLLPSRPACMSGGTRLSAALISCVRTLPT